MAPLQRTHVSPFESLHRRQHTIPTFQLGEWKDLHSVERVNDSGPSANGPDINRLLE